MSDYATLFGGGKPTKLWVSGRTYKTEEFVISPTNSHPYMRRTNGAGATDPCNDKTNWRLIGPGGIKSIQRGIISFSSSASSATVTISAVDTTNAQLRLLGWLANNEERLAVSHPYIELTSPTVITARRIGNSSGISHTTTLSWEVTELWS